MFLFLFTEPSSILPPSTFHEIINGPKVKHDSEADNSDKDDTAKKSHSEEKEVESDKDEEKTKINPVLGGIWNQDLMFISNATEIPDENQQQNKESLGPSLPENAKKKGCKVMKPR